MPERIDAMVQRRACGEIVVCEDVFGPAIEELAQRFEVLHEPDLWQRPGELAAAIRQARALIVRNRTRVTRKLMEEGERLVVIGRAGAGLDNVDVGAASELGIVVCYAPVQNATSVAEHTLGLIICLLRHIARADRSVREGQWLRHEHTGHELAGKVLGVVGLGRVGSRVAAYGRALGMRVIAHDPYLADGGRRAAELGCELVGLADLLARADVVSLHVPLTDETQHMIDRRALGQMKPTAVLINTSRGGVVDETALAEALEAGEIGGAALDVREEEPPPPDSPLHRLDNTLLTPHIAAFTEEAQAAVVEAVASDVAAVLSGRPATYYANFPQPKR